MIAFFILITLIEKTISSLKIYETRLGDKNFRKLVSHIKESNLHQFVLHGMR